MVGPSKILTVSYGTFSCTLEGFDDPFSTMRGIAEYFRDLAADDRYFGAEPPTPDAEMLHRIAEREVQRRVEARVGDHGITLRQVEKHEAPTPPEATPPAAAVEDRAGENMFADIGLDGSTEAETDDDLGYADAEPVAPVPPAADDTSVAAKLSRIRAVVTAGAAAAPAAMPFTGPIEDAFADDADEAGAHDAGADGNAGEDADAEPLAEAPAEAEATPEADVVDAGIAGESAEIAEEMIAATEAEDLGDLSALDAPADTADAAAPVDDGPQPEVSVTSDAVEAAEDVADKMAVAPSEETAPPAAATPEPAMPDAAASPDAATDTDATGTAPDEDAAFGGESIAARILRLKQSAMAASAPADDTPPPAEAAEVSDNAPEAAADMAEAPAEAAPDEGPTGPEATTPPAPDSVADDDDDLDIDLDDLIGRRPSSRSTSRPISREPQEMTGPSEPPVADEEGLAAMKAAIAEAAHAVDEIDVPEEPMKPPADAPEAEDSAESAQKLAAFEPEETGEVAFDRILEQTNSRMDESEGSRRRSAIAHLKAAVAATKADRLLKRMKGPEEKAAEEQSRYREDLAKVVQPSRPVTEPRDAAPAAPAEAAEPAEHAEHATERASPLMLVSELRVDGQPETTDAQAAPPVAPDTGFADFAAKMGAKELPDLLEAAAAYSAFVEGQREFSRPQLMRRVEGCGRSDYSREAGLRSFGQLLRQGKLQKLKRGQFTVTQETRFNPDARIAGE